MKISVIIPIYNTEQKLVRCLDSVRNQSFSDFECIMVDDGSTDDSPKIADRYAAIDSRFKAIHKPNGGVSSARNVGLDQAAGEWIVFVDSDDVLKENHLSIMYSAINMQIDFVYTSWEVIKRDNSIRNIISKDICYQGKEQVRDFICKSEILDYMMPWGKMFRRSIIENKKLRFDTNLTISEDRLFCYNYLLDVRGAVTLSDISYTHDASDINSLSNRSYSTKIYEYRYKAFIAPTSQLIKHFDIYTDESFLLWKYLWSLFTTVIFSINSSSSNIWTMTKKQKQFFSKYFCWDLYNLLKDAPKNQLFMKRPENNQIIKQQFLSLNMKIFIRMFLQKIKNK